MRDGPSRRPVAQVASTFAVLLCAVTVLAAIGGCADGSSPSGPGGETGETYDIDANGIPRFVAVDCITLDDIYRISKFRSGVGHDYSDDFESCRSMKHYFQPSFDVDWSTVEVFSPVDGTVSRMWEEWAGTQVQVRSGERPAFFFNVFHINLSDPLVVGDSLSAGQPLGNHIGAQTMSDIAVWVNTPSGPKLISYFDVMTDSLFQGYQARGLSSREDAVISRDARDADPLSCYQEEFADTGNIANWVVLD
ncbi:MAG: hypothetical protein ABIE42_00135 [Candidatus Eisenbacteria bacterium]